MNESTIRRCWRGSRRPLLRGFIAVALAIVALAVWRLLAVDRVGSQVVVGSGLVVDCRRIEGGTWSIHVERPSSLDSLEMDAPPEGLRYVGRVSSRGEHLRRSWFVRRVCTWQLHTRVPPEGLRFEDRWWRKTPTIPSDLAREIDAVISGRFLPNTQELEIWPDVAAVEIPTRKPHTWKVVQRRLEWDWIIATLAGATLVGWAGALLFVPGPKVSAAYRWLNPFSTPHGHCQRCR